MAETSEIRFIVKLRGTEGIPLPVPVLPHVNQTLNWLTDIRSSSPDQLGPSVVFSADADYMSLVLERYRILRDEVEALREQVERLAGVVGTTVVEIRDISDEQAATEIKTYFEERHGEVAYPSEVAERLALDYDQVKRVVAQLESEGNLAAAEEA